MKVRPARDARYRHQAKTRFGQGLAEEVSSVRHLRMMAIDATVEDVPDTPQNAAAFGRQQGSRGQSAFPQVRGVYLSECGTHTIVDASFWPCAISERVGALRMLRSVEPGMLVMWDRGMHSFDMFPIAQQ